jgi:hypothetical protein
LAPEKNFIKNDLPRFRHDLGAILTGFAPNVIMKEMTMVILVLGAALMAFNSEGYQEFSKHSNGMAEYVFVDSRSCPNGLRDSGYTLTPTGTLMLKQVNTDGSVSDLVCANNAQ